MTRPSDTPEWATGVGASKTAPGASLVSNGWGYGAEAPSDVMNWWMHNVHLWLAYLDTLSIRVFDSIEALADALSPGEVGFVREPYADPIVGATQLGWREAWTATTPGDATRIVCDGVRVYVLYATRYVRAYNAVTGVQEWEYDTGSASAIDLSCDGAFVYVVSSGVRCLVASTGALLQTITPVRSAQAAVSDGHAVYIFGRNVGGSDLYAYERPNGVGSTLLDTVALTDGGAIQRLAVSRGLLALARAYDSSGGGAAPALRIFDVHDPSAIVSVTGVNIGTTDVRDVHGDGQRWWIATGTGIYRRALRFKDKAFVNITDLHPSGGTSTEDWRAVCATDDQLLAVKVEATNGELSISPKPIGAETSPVWGELQLVVSNVPFRDICSDTRRAYWCGDDVGSGNTVKALWLPNRPQLYMRASTQDRDRAPFHGVVVPMRGL